MHFPCDNASALVPSYLDDELTEEQAAPLRRHLLACPACREVAMDLKALRRWFVAEPAPVVPAGFAARVARRAFAGDPGTLVPADAPDRSLGGAELLPFVLRMTAVAAAVLLVFAVGIRMQSIPDASDGLRADGLEVWEEIYDLPASPGDPAARRVPASNVAPIPAPGQVPDAAEDGSDELEPDEREAAGGR